MGKAVARPVDLERHAARRLQIIDAGLTVFSERGYDGATTARICQQAGIGSGTFFHYFATKADLLVAILELGTDEVRERAAGLADRTDPVGVLLELVGSTAEDAADPRIPGFVRAVAGVMDEPRIAEALAVDDAAQRDVLRQWVERGQSAGEVRTDVPAERIVSWLLLLTGGFLERVAVDERFDPTVENGLLVATARNLLRGG